MDIHSRPYVEPAIAAALSLLVLWVGSACDADPRPRDVQRAAAADTVWEPPALRTLPEIVSAARGFPAMWTADGAPLADGVYARWPDGDLVRITQSYDLADGRRIEEESSFAPGPPLEQRTWRWTESREEQRIRHFEVDFGAGTTVVERLEDGRLERDEGEIEVRPGTTFAGFGFTLALQSRRERLTKGVVEELQAVVFMFGSRTVTVEVSHAGVERMRMGGRDLTGDRFDIVPQIPWLADLVVDAPTSRIWLLRPTPAEFLRFEGPLLEPDDPVVRIDLLPGAESGAAVPVTNDESPAAGEQR